MNIRHLLCWLCASATPSLPAVDFSHDVVPILKQHCAECHGGGEAKGGFSLNTRELFLESGAVDVGDAETSYLIELVSSKDPDMQMPPPESDRVPAEQLDVLRKWIDESVPWESGWTFAESTFRPSVKLKKVTLPGPAETHPIDQLMGRYLESNGSPPLEPADDRVMLRRTSLDLIGLLPTADEVTEYLNDTSPDKHDRLVRKLLSRDVDYAEHWLTFWNDLLRNDYTGTGFITKGRTQISRWLYDSLVDNKPYDVMTRELIAPPTPESAGFADGIKWRGEVSAGQTLPIQFSQSISQSMLGINMKCASCHDSFIDQWKLSDAYALAAIYADEPLELHRCDKPTGEPATPAWLFPELGDIDPNAEKPARLKRLAALMTAADNGRFSRTIVNRLWGQLMGRGIVHPLDAMDTRPFDEDLLDFLAAYLIRKDHDLKAVLHLIATSQAYRSSVATVPPAEEAPSFTGPVVKRLTAEQLVDAIWQLTGAAPTQFDAKVKRDDRMVRASLVASDPFQRALGRPNRDQIVTSRPNDLTTLEALNLANGEWLSATLARGAERWIEKRTSNAALADELFLACLCRPPNDAERKIVDQILGERPDRRVIEDLLWSVMMKPEFLLVR